MNKGWERRGLIPRPTGGWTDEECAIVEDLLRENGLGEIADRMDAQPGNVFSRQLCRSLHDTGVSDEALARAMNVSYALVLEWKSGHAIPWEAYWRKIWRAIDALRRSA